MDFIKKNKFTIIAIVIFVVLVFVGYQVYRGFFPDTGSALYGDRLNGIEKVEIKDDKLDSVVSIYEENEIIKEASANIKGKLVNFIITVNDDIEVGRAKELTSVINENFKEEQLNFYDFQILIKKDNQEDTKFPIIGYKHHTKSGFTFTKDR